ncbi:hypothetical protein [Halorientalis marina]|uniref:hypothetical protein n=1 Tax=Halorientalis marina TaxID=2931976 RepID=UPI001FF4F342|nr:hypothetical protein [Halorientalis marina]
MIIDDSQNHGGDTHTHTGFPLLSLSFPPLDTTFPLPRVRVATPPVGVREVSVEA